MNEVLVFLGDIDPRKNSSIGISKVCDKLLEALKIKYNKSFTIVITDKNKDNFKDINCKKILLKEHNIKIVHKIMQENIDLPKIISREKPKFVILPRGRIPIIKIPRVKYIPIIYDTIIEYYAKKLKPKYMLAYLLMIFSCKRADAIITISKTSKAEIRKLTNKYIHVVTLGYDCNYPNLKKEDKDYIFVAGNKYPHKNRDIAIETIKDYNKDRNTNYKIVTSNGSLSDKQMVSTYRNAKLTIILSDREGFGLQLIESYSNRTPVVFNNVSSLKEIGKNLPGKCYVKDKESIYNAIDEVLKMSDKEVLNIKDSLERKYNWNKFYKEINNIIDKELKR